MPVVDHLPRRERGRHELQPIDDGVEAALQDLDQVLARIAAAADRLGIVFAELLLTDVAVMALQLLLGPELHAEIGGLAAALAMLARRVVVIAVPRALAAAPEVHAEAAVDLVLGADALDRNSTRLHSSH